MVGVARGWGGAPAGRMGTSVWRGGAGGRGGAGAPPPAEGVSSGCRCETAALLQLLKIARLLRASQVRGAW